MRSADGTRIGYRRLGSGPAVVMVHGSVSTHTDWMPAARLLSDRFTCFAMDRRGRRGSGFGHGPYSIEREYEDVCAVLDAAGRTPYWPVTLTAPSAPWARRSSVRFQS